ncbi:MAG: decaprenyl-phosphate phosphoribosyltransferase [Candidatus Omnitrophota bacterium]
MTKQIIYVAQLLRMKQWVKNFFIFFPLIFAGQLFQIQSALDTLLTFIAFCLIASGVYVFNDLLDIEKDRLHPKKSKRPLAKGHVHKPLIIGLILFLILIGLGLSSWVDHAIFAIASLYVLLHIIYNFYAKRVVIVDVMFVAAGFQIRIWAGSLAAGVFPSEWLQMCVFLLALYLGFTKRRYELSTLKEEAANHRRVLTHYTSYLLDQIIIICSTLTVVFYGLYVLSPSVTERLGNSYMVYSMVFVIYGVFRYLYLIHVKKLGDDPGDVIFGDFPLLLSILLWFSYILILFYFRT